jgi:hypothetical protein
MHAKINLALMAVVALLSIILLGGCAASSSGTAASPSATSSSTAPPGGIAVQQVPMTGYMRSQVGTPNELSPLAPATAKNVHKVGDQWVCEMNGQTYVFNGADWVPQQ